MKILTRLNRPATRRDTRNDCGQRSGQNARLPRTRQPPANCACGPLTCGYTADALVAGQDLNLRLRVMSTPTHVPDDSSPVPDARRSKPRGPPAPRRLARRGVSRLHIWLHPRHPRRGRSPVEVSAVHNHSLILDRQTKTFDPGSAPLSGAIRVMPRTTAGERLNMPESAPLPAGLTCCLTRQGGHRHAKIRGGAVTSAWTARRRRSSSRRSACPPARSR